MNTLKPANQKGVKQMIFAANLANAAATGDEANVALYVVLVVIAVALVAFLGLKEKIIKPKDGKADEAKKDASKTDDTESK